MDVHLLVYDLSGGLARQLSMSLLGFQLDAIYHTSIELDGVEYVYDGGINTIRPGSSHLGKPLERLLLGKTDLPIEVIVEYVDSLRSIFTPEAYDLFKHNCNNFSNDFAMFLLGKGIPDHISNMPQAVLESPFGRMLQPQLESMVQARKAQQGGLLGIQSDPLHRSAGSPNANSSQTNGRAPKTAPRHPHETLHLPHFVDPDVQPVLYTKPPPLDKLVAKMGNTATNPSIQGMKHFVEARAAEGPAYVALPDLQGFSALLCSGELPTEVMFPVVDLFRCVLIDARASGYFAEEAGHKTVVTLLEYVNSQGPDCSYALRLVTLQAACNLFSSPLYPEQILSQSILRDPITQLVSTSFLDDSHNNVRVAAASLLFNIATANSKKRRSSPSEDLIPESDQVELGASVLEAITQENSSAEALHGMLLALGYLVYCAPPESELIDLLRTMDAKDTVLAKTKQFPQEGLVHEVGAELLGRGLR